MPASKKKIKAIFKEALDDYMDREQGPHDKVDPAELARNMMDIADQCIDDAEKELSRCGQFMRPGMKQAFKNYLKKNLRNL